MPLVEVPKILVSVPPCEPFKVKAKPVPVITLALLILIVPVPPTIVVFPANVRSPE